MTTDYLSELQELNELPNPETKGQLLERMAVAYAAAEAFLAAHSEAELTRPLSESGWSAKDYIAHLRDWEKSMVALLNNEVRYQSMGLTKELAGSGDYDAQNDVLYARHQNRPLADILADFRHTHQTLVALLAGLDDSDLQKPYIHYQPDAETVAPGDYVNNPVMGWLIGDTYGHYAEHILDIGRLLE